MFWKGRQHKLDHFGEISKGFRGCTGGMQQEMSCEHGRPCQAEMVSNHPTSVESKKGGLPGRESDLLIILGAWESQVHGEAAGNY